MDTREPLRASNERGIAMITTLLVMMLVSALLIGFTALVVGDQRFRFIDRDRTQSFYAASAGLEKLTADLGNLFFIFVAPTASQISALTVTPPSIPGATFKKSDNTTGYQITSQNLGSTTISSGPYQGLYALITLYTMDVTARTPTGGETHLQRQTETVAIPVFQFGIFSDVDLSFFAGPNFNFGGRVHSNGNLFLAEGSGATLTLSDKVTAVKEVIRQRLQNGVSIDAQPHTGTVNVATAPNAYRALARTEGSVVDGVNSALNDPTWHNISLSTYNGYIRNGRTGAKALNLPLLTFGGVNNDLVRRPVKNENVDNVTLYGERFYTKASLRILLSDTVADITDLPGLDTAKQPILLDGNWNAAAPNNGIAYGPINASHPPIATSPGPQTATTSGATAAGATSIGVVNIPAFYQTPSLTINGMNVPCTKATATSFRGCTTTASIPANANFAVTAAVTSGAGTITASTTTANTSTIAAGTNKTIQVVSTASFFPGFFWLSGTLVSCSGYDTTTAPPTFTTCTNVPAAASGSTITNYALSSAGTSQIGGYIKIELQDTANVWHDVTMEILNYGIGGPNLAGTACADPTPNAILRVQRLRDNGGSATCDYSGSINSNDYWPNTLFDAREALQRDCGTGANCTAAGNMVLDGVMHYLTLDVANLSKWFNGTAPFAAGTGTTALSNSGFTVYFSDRRNNRDANSKETGEYGFEDFVNPLSPTGTPNNTLDAGEDVNASGTLDIYGRMPSYNGVASSVPPGAAAPLDINARPTTQLTQGQSQVNRAVLFRRALKLINGGLGNIVKPGLTVVAENPVYIQGNWNMNANPPPANDNHAATSVIADAVTLLSNSWNDNTSFTAPYNPANRNRNTQTYYRVAIVSGKGMSFPQPNNTANDFGTDGGAHNFLRYLENGDQAVNYLGSIATFYYNRQAVGTYKCCTTVYGAPTRNYSFDIDFLDATKLPPLTPVFRDLNTIGFSQEIRPGR